MNTKVTNIPPTLSIIEDVSKITVFESSKLDDLINQIEIEAKSLVADPKTAKGRAALISEAFKVTKSKTHIAALGRGSIEEHSTIVKVVTRAVRDMESRLSAIATAVKQPAIDWERDELARKVKIDGRISDIFKLAADVQNLSSAELHLRIDDVVAVNTSLCEEFQKAAVSAKEEVLSQLTIALPIAEIREKNAAELKRLQDAEAKRLAEQVIVDAEKARVERERVDAERMKKAEALREIETEKRLKQAKLDERNRLKRIAERKKAKEEYDLEIAKGKEEERVANKKHRQEIQYAISSALQDGWNMVPRDSQEIIQAIESGQIPHLKIQY